MDDSQWDSYFNSLTPLQQQIATRIRSRPPTLPANPKKQRTSFDLLAESALSDLTDQMIKNPSRQQMVLAAAAPRRVLPPRKRSGTTAFTVSRKPSPTNLGPVTPPIPADRFPNRPKQDISLLPDDRRSDLLKGLIAERERLIDLWNDRIRPGQTPPSPNGPPGPEMVDYISKADPLDQPVLQDELLDLLALLKDDDGSSFNDLSDDVQDRASNFKSPVPPQNPKAQPYLSWDGNGQPRVASLTLNDVSKEDGDRIADDVMGILSGIRNQDIDWNDKASVESASNSAEQLHLELNSRLGLIQNDLRDSGWYQSNVDDVHEHQMEMVAHHEAMRELSKIRSDLANRARALTQRDIATESLDVVRNHQKSDAERVKAFDAATKAVDSLRSDFFIGDEALEGVPLARLFSESQKLKNEMDEARARVEGPKTLQGILEEHPALGFEQARLDRAVYDHDAATDKSDHVATITARLADMRDEQSALGPEVDPFGPTFTPIDRMENLRRRWLSKNIETLSKTIDEKGSSARAAKIRRTIPGYVAADPNQDLLDSLSDGRIPRPSWNADGVERRSQLAAVYKATGFDGLGRAVDDDELDDLIAGGAIQLFRNVKEYGGTSLLDDLRTGEYYPGHGVYGWGTYAAEHRSVTSGYGNTRVRMALPADANMVDYQELQKEMTKELGLNTELNVGVYAVTKGYDGIIVAADYVGDTSPYYVILNRTMMAIGPVLTGAAATAQGRP
jgi:hypothetical protein